MIVYLSEGVESGLRDGNLTPRFHMVQAFIYTKKSCGLLRPSNSLFSSANL